MRSIVSALFLIIFLSLNLKAQVNCGPCTPLAEVAITNAGLSRISELALVKNFETFNEEVVNRAGFRNIKLDYDIDYSKCNPTTLETAIRKKITKEKVIIKTDEAFQLNIEMIESSDFEIMPSPFSFAMVK